MVLFLHINPYLDNLPLFFLIMNDIVENVSILFVVFINNIFLMLPLLVTKMVLLVQ